MIAQADSALAEAELSVLSEIAKDLSPSEQAYLNANVQWMNEIPPSPAVTRRILRQATEEAKREAAKFAIVMAAADGRITTEEVRTLEKLAKNLEIGEDEIYSALHAGGTVDEPVVIIPKGDDGKTFTIPGPPSEKDPAALDRDLLAKRKEDSERGFGILAAIFQEQEYETLDALSEVEGSEENESRFPGLDYRHTAILDDLLNVEDWDGDTFDNLALKHSLMSAAAAEAINDWAIETHGEPLVEDDGDTLNRELQIEIKSESKD